jgi:hypothetical protein
MAGDSSTGGSADANASSTHCAEAGDGLWLAFTTTITSAATIKAKLKPARTNPRLNAILANPFIPYREAPDVKAEQRCFQLAKRCVAVWDRLLQENQISQHRGLPR